MDKDIKTGFELGLGNECTPGADFIQKAPEADNTDYEVGYRRPPKDKQFKAGKSGNPKGRPRHSTNFNEALNKKMATLMTVTEHGVRKKKTTLDILAQMYVNKLLNGDDKLLAVFIRENAQDVRIENILYPRELKPEPTPEEEARNDEILKVIYATLDERYRG